MRTIQKGGCHVGPLSEPIPLEVGLQIPCGLHPEAPAEDPVWESAASTRGDFSCLGSIEGVPDSRRASPAGPCAHCVAIPPKHSVASVIGFLKGKSAIAVARMRGRERNVTGEHLWARGYAVSTVGFELEQVRQYIREQEAADGTDGSF